MTRVTEAQLASGLLNYTARHRSNINRLNDDISSGIRVRNPGDSNVAGTISLMQQNLEKAEGYKNSIASAKSRIDFQDNVLTQVNELLVRAKEIATQAANESLSPTNRNQLSTEVMQIRDHLVSLANSQYQGKYIYGGTRDDAPPYNAQTYTNPSTGLNSQRYTYSTAYGTTGSGALKTVNLTDNLTLTLNTPGNQVFDDAIQGLERLGRSMAGYRTTLVSGVPDGTSAAYTFPADYSTQTQDIKAAMDFLDSARQNDISVERVDLAGRMRRIETAESLVNLTKTTSKEALDSLQNTDMYTAATDLSQAQTALQASLTVSTKVLQMSILDYI
jgi:flagellar hook-associated protein 3 FlgL